MFVRKDDTRRRPIRFEAGGRQPCRQHRSQVSSVRAGSATGVVTLVTHRRLAEEGRQRSVPRQCRPTGAGPRLPRASRCVASHRVRVRGSHCGRSADSRHRRHTDRPTSDRRAGPLHQPLDAALSGTSQRSRPGGGMRRSALPLASCTGHGNVSPHRAARCTPRRSVWSGADHRPRLGDGTARSSRTAGRSWECRSSPGH